LEVSTSRNTPMFWSPLWHLKSKKSQKNAKTQCPESSLEKVWSQSTPKTAKCRFYIQITICFERSNIFILGGFWSPFASLLESVFDTFGEKVGFGSSKTGVLKKHRKLMKTGHAGTANFWLCAPKRDPRIQQLEAGNPGCSDCLV